MVWRRAFNGGRRRQGRGCPTWVGPKPTGLCSTGLGAPQQTIKAASFLNIAHLHFRTRGRPGERRRSYVRPLTLTDPGPARFLQMMIGARSLSVNGKAEWPSRLLPMFSSFAGSIERKNRSMRRRYAPNRSMSSFTKQGTPSSNTICRTLLSMRSDQSVRLSPASCRRDRTIVALGTHYLLSIGRMTGWRKKIQHFDMIKPWERVA